MRRLVAVSLAFAAATLGGPSISDASAQALGVRGGLSLATLGGDDVDEADARIGLAVGGTVTFPLTPTLGLQLGIGYAQKGATESDGDDDFTLALDYFEVPALLRLDVPTAGSIAPRFYIGPTVAFEAACSLDIDSGGTSVSFDCDDPTLQDLDVELETKSVDFGAMAGAGLSIGTAGPISFTLDVFYTLGLASIDDSSEGADVKNRAWSLLAGIELPIGG